MTKKIPYSAFKHGQRCTCEIDGEKVTDAKIDIDSNGSIYISQEGKDRRKVVSGGVHYTEYNFGNITNLILLPRTIEDVEENDIVVDSKDKREFCVLGKSGKAILLSKCSDLNMYGETITAYELEKLGFTIKQDTPHEEDILLQTKSCPTCYPAPCPHIKEEKEKRYDWSGSSLECGSVMEEQEKITHSVTMLQIANAFRIPLDQLRIKE